MTQAEHVPRPGADPAARRFELLAAIGERLGRSLDPRETVQDIADGLVPAFGDWCVIDLIGPDRSLEMVASSHRDPELASDIARLRAQYPPQDQLQPVHPIYRAIDQDATVVEEVNAEELRARSLDADHLELLQRLGIGSHIVIALEARDRVIGALSIIRRPERPAFDADEVATAEVIAVRAALATDNAQLYRAARESVELRDRFIALASHELRNPLAVVHGHWELLGRRLGGLAAHLPDEEMERIQASLARLGHGIDQLRRLVDELLDVRRLVTGGPELRCVDTDLGAVVRQAAEEAQGGGGERLRLLLPDEPVIGSWDPGRLEQVVINIVGNALKYSPEDTPVEVTLTASEDRARLAVTDAGIGIPPEELGSVFEPFRRAQNVEANRYPGLGLGLAVSREIILLHGGRMWAESDGVGRGSTFIVELDRRMS